MTGVQKAQNMVLFGYKSSCTNEPYTTGECICMNGVCNYIRC